jgi:hypothetical protein
MEEDVVVKYGVGTRGCCSDFARCRNIMSPIMNNADGVVDTCTTFGFG